MSTLASDNDSSGYNLLNFSRNGSYAYSQISSSFNNSIGLHSLRIPSMQNTPAACKYTRHSVTFNINIIRGSGTTDKTRVFTKLNILYQS